MDKHLVFSFDFDCTISEDPELFLSMMGMLELMGHTVVICTCRMPDTYPEDLAFLEKKGYKIYYTSHKAKKKYLADQGVIVDIWVDDTPESILQDWDGEARTYRDMEKTNAEQH